MQTTTKHSKGFTFISYTEGKCEYKITYLMDELLEEFFRHKEEGILAPQILFINNEASFSFDHISCSIDGLRILKENTEELICFIEKIKKMKEDGIIPSSLL